MHRAEDSPAAAEPLVVRPTARLPVHVPAVANLDDRDDLGGIVYFIQEAVVALANAVPLLAGKLLTTRGPGLLRQPSNAVYDAGQIAAWQALKLLGCGLLEKEPIAFHGS